MTSHDVIHSFWVPQLQGKLDLIPGQTNHLLFRVANPGIYRGQCAEFCGVQHANMFVFVIADEDFDSWAERNQQPVTMPDDPFLRRGWEVFFANSCVYCHALQGTDAQGSAGPDLSNMGSRTTLGSGVMQNNAGNLAGWIINPHARKPGNFMPPTDLSGEDLSALVDFLLSLQ
jgi:cytochrome c oxidase subunit II